jgi:hypothetical protein
MTHQLLLALTREIEQFFYSRFNLSANSNLFLLAYCRMIIDERSKMIAYKFFEV